MTLKGFKSSAEADDIEINNFSSVIYTSEYSQIVLMKLLQSDEIGLDPLTSNDYFFRPRRMHDRRRRTNPVWL
jgi:hypothetical protein